MIQRIQSLYLLAVAIVSGGLSFVFCIFKTIEKSLVFAADNMVFISLFLASAILSLITIFLFKNRKLQFVFGRLNIILNFILLGLFVYHLLNESGETYNVSEKGFGMFLPLVSIVFVALANKAIQKDEALVKSVDRLR